MLFGRLFRRFKSGFIVNGDFLWLHEAPLAGGAQVERLGALSAGGDGVRIEVNSLVGYLGSAVVTVLKVCQPTADELRVLSQIGEFDPRF